MPDLRISAFSTVNAYFESEQTTNRRKLSERAPYTCQHFEIHNAFLKAGSISHHS